MQSISLALQTTFAELIERCLDASFDRDFDEQGQFVKVTSKAREYWYFQKYQHGGRNRRYVGPVSEPEITSRVKKFKELKADFSERREMVRALGQILPRPDGTTGAVVEALWKAGFFRLRGVLVGTVAFQAYAGLLGLKLPSTSIMTQDADFAQFKAISDAVGDTMPPILDVLQEVDEGFKPVPALDPASVTAFINQDQYRVEFLTPNRGSDEHQGKTAEMPALGGAGATPLRYLDFLIKDPVWSVVLYRGGVAVRVPDPARYAVHKMIVSTRRHKTAFAKADKDIFQAGILIEALSKHRSFELGEAMSIAESSGPKWKAAIEQASTALNEETLVLLEKAREAFRKST
ncbi:GSU2403 family nucleotidyltransferase fold protein [Nitratireductor sp. XY-223]|uniref:nucleotidyltransferase family protein n=1 Tax=Nitratireductor sp. XY-223 TaxID=2561926 RepID=UPI0010AAE67A|nr:GSU2403 family nucleotidyltransferase fold protein [Nitratireductor sp. XY-223]